jgi:sRNA-binding protein
MTSRRAERDRGIKEASQQLVALQEKWPLAFPIRSHDIRPLAVRAAGEIAAGLGWSMAYTCAVLRRWKMAPVYCRAVLAFDQRITLDGTPAEPVDAAAKELATKQLAKLAVRKASKVAEAVKAAPPAAAKPKPKPAEHLSKPAPTEAPAPLRDRVRASLLRRGDGGS